MKTSAKSIRVYLLVCVLLIGLYFLYRLLYPSRASETTAAGLDTSDFSLQAIPRHIEALKSQDTAVRQKAAKALWQIVPGTHESIAALIVSVKDPDPGVREMAAKALGPSSEGSLDAVPTLIAALKDQEGGVRAEAARALAEIWVDSKGRSWEGKGGGEKMEEMRERRGLERREGEEDKAEEREREREAERQHPPVRPKELSPAAIAAMRNAVPALTAALHDSDARVRANAAEALNEIGTRAEPALADLEGIVRDDPDSTCRARAAQALGSIGPPAKSAVPILVEHLAQDKVEAVRSSCGMALGLIHAQPEVVVPALVKAFLRETYNDTQGVMMFGLAQFGPEVKRALPVLQAAAKDPQNQKNETLMKQINRALRAIEPNVKAFEAQKSGRK